MEQFSLDKWLQDKSRKVVTKNGKNVRIVCTDSPNPKYPIYGFIEGDIYITSWRSDGRFSNLTDFYDLFFADEKEKLTEFEKMLIQFSHERDSIIKWNKEGVDEFFHKYSTKLFDLARKEILKDLPKWKKMPNGIQGNSDFNPIYLVKTSYGHCFTTPCLSWDKDNMYIELSELEKLPKED